LDVLTHYCKTSPYRTHRKHEVYALNKRNVAIIP